MNRLKKIINKPKGETIFDYDVEGNLIRERRQHKNKPELIKDTHYSFDSANRLLEVDMPYIPDPNIKNVSGQMAIGEKVKFRYDGNGMRVEKEYISEGVTEETNLTIFHYDLAGNLIMESDEDGNTKNVYIYGNGMLVCRYDYSKASTDKLSKLYFHWENTGSIIRLTDKDGKQVQKYEYDPYGNIIEAEGIVLDNPFRFSQKYYDIETGLYYYGARYYNPEYGRWLSEDPIVANIFNTRDNNSYQFCYNNPNIYIDIWGMHAVEIARVASEEWIYTIAEVVPGTEKVIMKTVFNWSKLLGESVKFAGVELAKSSFIYTIEQMIERTVDQQIKLMMHTEFLLKALTSESSIIKEIEASEVLNFTAQNAIARDLTVERVIKGPGVGSFNAVTGESAKDRRNWKRVERNVSLYLKGKPIDELAKKGIENALRAIQSYLSKGATGQDWDLSKTGGVFVTELEPIEETGYKRVFIGKVGTFKFYQRIRKK